MNIDSSFLKNHSILYIEDDEIIRLELAELLESFFLKVYTANNGKEALEVFSKNSDIKLIISDINMPILNGIEMLKEIRKFNKDIPIIFATAYSDNNFLLDSIKLKVEDYILKPIDIKNLISTSNKILRNLYQETILEQQKKELFKYKDIIDNYNIVIKTDIDMKINYVNSLFCDITGFSKDELIGKSLNSLKHKNVSHNKYIEIYEILKENRPWNGILKNIKKDNSSYTTDCHFSPINDDLGNLIGIISVQKDISDDLEKNRRIKKALLKKKSESFFKNKKENQNFSNLEIQIEKLEKILQKTLKNNDRYIHSNKKYKMENQNLKTEILLFKKNENIHSAYKLAKQNNDLKVSLKKSKDKTIIIKNENEEKLNSLKEYYENEISQLKDEVYNLNKQFKAVKTDEMLIQQSLYWKDKAKQELEKLERLEKLIIDYADTKLLHKIFG